MFAGLGNLTGLLKQAKQLQENLQRAQQALASQVYEADAGGGLVRASVNGRLELVSVKIDPKATDDVEMLEDLVRAAIGSAQAKARQGAQAHLAQLTGGLNLPGLADLLGGAP